jgi:hypothetical protein
MSHDFIIPCYVSVMGSRTIRCIMHGLVALALAACGAARKPAPAPPAPPAPTAPPAKPAAACDAQLRATLAAFESAPTCACGDRAACAAKCDAGSARDCAATGGCYGTAIFGVEPEKFYAFSARACALGEALGCRNEGHALAIGFGAAKDPARSSVAFARALAAYRAGCDRGDASDCSMLGHAYDKGEGVVADAARAGELRARACELGDGFACLLRAIDAHERGAEPAAWVARACEASCGAWCPSVDDARSRFSEASAAAVTAWRARCDRGTAKTCR